MKECRNLTVRHFSKFQCSCVARMGRVICEPLLSTLAGAGTGPGHHWAGWQLEVCHLSTSKRRHISLITAQLLYTAGTSAAAAARLRTTVRTRVSKREVTCQERENAGHEERTDHHLVAKQQHSADYRANLHTVAQC